MHTYSAQRAEIGNHTFCRWSVHTAEPSREKETRKATRCWLLTFSRAYSSPLTSLPTSIFHTGSPHSGSTSFFHFFRTNFPFHAKMATVQINGNTANLARLPDSVPKDAESTNFILIQGHSDLTPSQKQNLEDSKANILEYVSRNTYLCRYEPKDLSAIRAMASVKSVIP